MYILGINCAYHESSAALLKDGSLIAAAEEERFIRVKHAKPARVDNPDILPLHAIDYCLQSAGITLADVGYIGCSMLPEKRLENYMFKEVVVPGDWGSYEGEKLFYDKLMTIPGKLVEMGFKGNFEWVGHHLCHAASTYYPSGFEHAAVLVVDGIGETGTAMLAEGRGTNMAVLDEIQYPSSIGFLWEKMSMFLGFDEYDACKVMGMAAYGHSDVYRNQFESLVSFHDEYHFTVNKDVLQFRIEDYAALEDLFKVTRRLPSDPITQDHMNIAASLQEVTEKLLIKFASTLHEKTQADSLCLAGGVALNCVVNASLMEKRYFKRLYVQPASNDAGTALGAAQIIWHSIVGSEKRETLVHTYYGPSFSNDEVLKVLRQSDVIFELVSDIEQRTAELLAEQKIVGWFQGRMEFGPRALGNRSLLADPRSSEMRERINHIVKHREDFRPFAPSVLIEEAAEWFEINDLQAAAEFMLVNYKAKSPDKIAAVVHVDGTSRLQLVRKDINSKYHALISNFYRITGVPMVLNTSFNDREPIVCTPTDAIRTFKKSQIDHLVIGDFLVSKRV